MFIFRSSSQLFEGINLDITSPLNVYTTNRLGSNMLIFFRKRPKALSTDCIVLG